MIITQSMPPDIALFVILLYCMNMVSSLIAVDNSKKELEDDLVGLEEQILQKALFLEIGGAGQLED